MRVTRAVRGSARGWLVRRCVRSTLAVCGCATASMCGCPAAMSGCAATSVRRRRAMSRRSGRRLPATVPALRVRRAADDQCCRCRKRKNRAIHMSSRRPGAGLCRIAGSQRTYHWSGPGRICKLLKTRCLTDVRGGPALRGFRVKRVKQTDPVRITRTSRKAQPIRHREQTQWGRDRSGPPFHLRARDAFGSSRSVVRDGAPSISRRHTAWYRGSFLSGSISGSATIQIS